MFTIHFNRYSDRNKRRYLRNNPTEAEKKLWQVLRKKLIPGFKFRRQYGIDAYVVDFYYPRLKLAIELDGEIHQFKGMRLSDTKRQEYIQKFNISFLRFTNYAVFNDIEEVISTIETKVKYLEGANKIV